MPIRPILFQDPAECIAFIFYGSPIMELDASRISIKIISDLTADNNFILCGNGAELRQETGIVVSHFCRLNPDIKRRTIEPIIIDAPKISVRSAHGIYITERIVTKTDAPLFCFHINNLPFIVIFEFHFRANASIRG